MAIDIREHKGQQKALQHNSEITIINNKQHKTKNNHSNLNEIKKIPVETLTIETVNHVRRTN